MYEKMGMVRAKRGFVEYIKSVGRCLLLLQLLRRTSASELQCSEIAVLRSLILCFAERGTQGCGTWTWASKQASG